MTRPPRQIPPELVALLRLGTALSIPPQEHLRALLESKWPMHDLGAGFGEVLGPEGSDALIRTMAFSWSSDVWKKGLWHGFMEPRLDCPLWALRYVVWHHPDRRAEAYSAASELGVHPWSVEPSIRSSRYPPQGGPGPLDQWLRRDIVSHLPENLRLVDLTIDRRFCLESLPEGLQAVNLHLRNNESLRHILWAINANHLQVTDCPNLESLGPAIQAFYARFARLPAMAKGPGLLRSQGEMRFEWCEHLEELCLEGVVDQLTLTSCPNLRELSGPIRIRRLVIHDCEGLSHLDLPCPPQEVVVQNSPRSVSSEAPGKPGSLPSSDRNRGSSILLPGQVQSLKGLTSDGQDHKAFQERSSGDGAGALGPSRFGACRSRLTAPRTTAPVNPGAPCSLRRKDEPPRTGPDP